MGQIKHLMDEVATRMGITDPNDPLVQAEVERLLSIPKRAEELAQTPAHCGRCGWEGTADELKTVYVPNPKDPGDVIPEAGCPECKFDGVDIGLTSHALGG